MHGDVMVDQPEAIPDGLSHVALRRSLGVVDELPILHGVRPAQQRTKRVARMPIHQQPARFPDEQGIAAAEISLP